MALHKLMPRNRSARTVAFWLGGVVFYLEALFAPSSLLADGADFGSVNAQTSTSASQRVARPRTSGLPLYFVENRGQVDPRVSYYVQGANKVIYFTADGVTLVLSKPAGQLSARARLAPVSLDATASPENLISRHALKLDFVGANAAAKPAGEDLAPARFSYFKGHRDDWITELKSYQRLVYADLWPGIDLVYSGSSERLKYQFVVKPGADPKQIRLRYRGADSISIDREGRLSVRTALEDFHDDRPTAYQEINGALADIPAEYALDSRSNGTRTYGFSLGAYDPTRTLIIDPALLVYAGFIGGAGNDRGNGVAVDVEGNSYVTGETNSTHLTSFPARVGPDTIQSGGVDAFVAKIDPTGTRLLYAGFIGGTGDDRGVAIAVDSAGNAYVTGDTTSTQSSFPATIGPDLSHNGSIDAFVAKVNASGTNLVYAGYIGGVGDDRGGGIALDASNRVYVVGETDSSNGTFPDGNGFGGLAGFDIVHNGGLDAFVARVAADGASLDYASFIGGIGTDRALNVAVDGSDRAYVTGATDSTPTSFPNGNGMAGLTTFDSTQNGDLDAFVVRVAANGLALEYAGYIGGIAADRGNGITVDGAGAAYVTGETSSAAVSFPDGNGLGLLPGPGRALKGGVDAFVAKIDAAGSALIYAGYIGGVNDDRGNAIALIPGCAADCDVYIAGETGSNQSTFPVSVGPDLTHNGGIDAFLAKINADGSLGLAGYVGGSGDDRGRGIALDAIGDVYLTGETNSTQATFPTKRGPDSAQNLGIDVFVAKICVTRCADLRVQKTDAADPVTVGSDVTYTITVTNNGPDIATNVELTDVLPSSIVLVSATPSTGSCAGTSTVVCDLGNLASGATETVTIVVTTTVVGNLTNAVSVTSDQTDTVPGNNQDEERTRVTLPNLAIKTLKAVGAAIPGTDIVVTDTTINRGKVAAAVTSTTSFYLSTNSKLDADDLFLASRAPIPALAPNESHTGSTTVTIPLTTALGKYFLIAVADDGNGIAETREKNAKARALNVTRPDLIVQSLRAPSSVAAGASITIDEITRNKAPVPADSTTTNYYLSTDAVFDGADSFLGGRGVGALAARGKSAGATIVTIPLTATPGKYFLLALSDADGGVTEVNESNNLRAKSITVTP